MINTSALRTGNPLTSKVVPYNPELTKRENELYALAYNNYTDRQIAEKLNLKLTSVQTAFNKIRERGVGVRYCIKSSLIDDTGVTSIMIGVHVQKSDREKLKTLAESRGIGMSTLVREFIIEGLKKADAYSKT